MLCVQIMCAMNEVVMLSIMIKILPGALPAAAAAATAYIQR